MFFFYNDEENKIREIEKYRIRSKNEKQIYGDNQIYNIGKLPQHGYFYKYMSLEAALMSLDYNRKSSLRFTEPTSWEDEYEGRFYNAEYKNVDPGGINSPSLYATCMTTKSENEAAWLTYTHGKEGLSAHCVEFTINKGKLREEIMKNYHDGNVYIGCVKYLKKNIIDHIHEKEIEDQSSLVLHDELKKSNKISNNEYKKYFGGVFSLEQYLNLLLLKRLAFEHEEEIRIFIVPNKPFNKYKGKRFSDEKENPASLKIKVNWINILEKVKIDKKCSKYEKELLQKAIDKLLLKEKKIWVLNMIGNITNLEFKKLIFMKTNVTTELSLKNHKFNF